mmetsp:Transcript_38500/g.63826  ORF Transcript_38500/g.63826 Transcript_38500/m.63826 type:complete len:273 (+) Transcript_38500:404-1222(+)
MRALWCALPGATGSSLVMGTANLRVTPPHAKTIEVTAPAGPTMLTVRRTASRTGLVMATATRRASMRSVAGMRPIAVVVDALTTASASTSMTASATLCATCNRATMMGTIASTTMASASAEKTARTTEAPFRTRRAGMCAKRGLLSSPKFTCAQRRITRKAVLVATISAATQMARPFPGAIQSTRISGGRSVRSVSPLKIVHRRRRRRLVKHRGRRRRHHRHLQRPRRPTRVQRAAPRIRTACVTPDATRQHACGIGVIVWISWRRCCVKPT